ncbi:MAG: hypothetical protein A4E55_01747 [Pelotomaculum sp. PtaU1.Bin035]|nr:MAG: hypothetical protein A4E55_01747 [Pelotomaculum sp. PtaU1.Bin035]
MSKIGYKICPVLIDNIELPNSIAHIKYADFRDWEYSESFYKGMGDLLDGIGIQYEVIESGITTFIIHNFQLIENLELYIWRLSDFIDAFLHGIVWGANGVRSVIGSASAMQKFIDNYSKGLGIISNIALFLNLNLPHLDDIVKIQKNLMLIMEILIKIDERNLAKSLFGENSIFKKLGDFRDMLTETAVILTKIRSIGTMHFLSLVNRK